MARLHVGTSGFSYREWRGTFYPRGLPAGRMLEHYAARLGGVELNGTFYRTPPAPTIASWAAAVPDGFRFCPKGHRGLTYSGAAFDKVGLARTLAPIYRGLGRSLGPVLLQFPPPVARDDGLLEAMLEALEVPCAVEFRNLDWLVPEVYALVSGRGGAVVVTDDEGWPRADPAAGEIVYLRLRRDYGEAELGEWAATVGESLKGAREVHVYFRHDVRAPWRAETLLHLISGAASPQAAASTGSSVSPPPSRRQRSTR